MCHSNRQRSLINFHVTLSVLIIIANTGIMQCLALSQSHSASHGAVVNSVDSQPTAASTASHGISWIYKLKSVRRSIKDCMQTNKTNAWECWKSSIYRALDSLLTVPVIPIWDGIRLVYKGSKNTYDSYASSKQKINSKLDEGKNLAPITFLDHLESKMYQGLSTRVLEVNFKDLADSYMRKIDKNDAAQDSETARHRRHRQHFMVTMMFGVTALGAILIPMGFQLLSVVSGKALLLAKMALLLASINGLKRVANSGVHYGLYHVPGEHYGGGLYDRGDAHHPRNVASFSVVQPAEFGIRK